MASTQEFVDYVCEQISLGGSITYKKMFGEYGIYCNHKIIGVVCDNQFFLKVTKAGRMLLREVVEVPAYEGAKPSFLITQLENKELMEKIIQATFEELPEPKRKIKK